MRSHGFVNEINNIRKTVDLVYVCPTIQGYRNGVCDKDRLGKNRCRAMLINNILN